MENVDAGEQEDKMLIEEPEWNEVDCRMAAQEKDRVVRSCEGVWFMWSIVMKWAVQMSWSCHERRTERRERWLLPCQYDFHKTFGLQEVLGKLQEWFDVEDSSEAQICAFQS